MGLMLPIGKFNFTAVIYVTDEMNATYEKIWFYRWVEYDWLDLIDILSEHLIWPMGLMTDEMNATDAIDITYMKFYLFN